MTLPSSGYISANMINLELKRSATAPFSINGAAERALAKKTSGAISFADFHGKSSMATVNVPLTPTPVGRNYTTGGVSGSAGFFIRPDGTWDTFVSKGGDTNAGVWLVSGEAASVQAKVIVNAGTTSSNDMFDWVDLNQVRSVFVSSTSSVERMYADFTIYFRDKATYQLIGQTPNCNIETTTITDF
ncbi:hypothetical protein EniLVp02_0085 [Vibrio phage EniLVp02]